MCLNYKIKWCVERCYVLLVVKNCCGKLVIDNSLNFMYVLMLCVYVFLRILGVFVSLVFRYWWVVCELWFLVDLVDLWDGMYDENEIIYFRNGVFIVFKKDYF